MMWFSKTKRGNYSIMMALGIPVLLGFAAIVIDMSRIQVAKIKIDQAAEAIAHSALVSLKNGDSKVFAQQKGRKTGMRNFVDGDKVNIRATKYVEFGEWNFDTQTWISKKSGYNAVKVTYGRTKDHREGELDMLLTPFMGVNYVSLGETQSSIAAFRTRDLCLVMDVTFSFVGEMPQAKQAALNLLDTMYDQNIPGDQICLVVFVGDSKLVTSLDDIYANKTAIRATWDGGAAVEKSPPCTRTTTNPHGQWECKENQWHLKRKILYYYWDGTYVFSETETEEYISGYKEETYYETELTGYERVPYTVSVEYEETETYQVSVKESYTERYEEDYDCKKFKMVTVPYTYTVEKRFEECKDVTSKKKESYTYYEEVPYKKKEKYWTWWYEKAERTVPYTHTYTVKYTEPEKFKVCKSVTKYKDLPVYIWGKYTETTTERYRDSWEATKTIKEEYDCSYVETWTEEVAYECGKDVTYYEVEEKECGKWKKVKVPYEKDCSYWDTKTTTEYYDCGGWVATYGKEAYDCSSVKPGGRGRGRRGRRGGKGREIKKTCYKVVETGREWEAKTCSKEVTKRTWVAATCTAYKKEKKYFPKTCKKKIKKTKYVSKTCYDEEKKSKKVKKTCTRPKTIKYTEYGPWKERDVEKTKWGWHWDTLTLSWKEDVCHYEMRDVVKYRDETETRYRLEEYKAKVEGYKERWVDAVKSVERTGEKWVPYTETVCEWKTKTEEKTGYTEERQAYMATCTREASRTAYRMVEEDRTRVVTKTRDETRYRNVAQYGKVAYTRKVAIYSTRPKKVKNMVPEYGSVTYSWEDTKYIKAHGITWCDNRCAFATRYSTSYADKTNNCSEAQAGYMFYVTATSTMHGVSSILPAHWAVDMPHCGIGGGNTNQGTGIDLATDEMLANGKAGSLRYMALVSDGAPTTPSKYWSTYYGSPDLKGHSASSWGVYQADDAWDNHGISISSISFNDETNPYLRGIQSSYMKSLVRGNGVFYETPDAKQLVGLLENIASNMEVVLVR